MPIVSRSTKLMKVKLQDVKVTNSTLTALGLYSKYLTELILVNLQNVTEKAFCSMANALGMQNLKCFSVASCQGLTDLNLVAIGQGSSCLKQVSLQKCEFLSDKGLKAFTEIASSLKNLLLDECNIISTFGLVCALGNCCRKLKVLTLERCKGITEYGLVTTPIPTCESLKFLNVRHCPAFGNKCLALLGIASPQLQSIDLNGLVPISDDGLFALLDDGLFAFLGSCKTTLVKLNLSGCVEVTDMAVIVIVMVFGKSLQSLNFDGYQKLTDQSLKFVA